MHPKDLAPAVAALLLTLTAASPGHAANWPSRAQVERFVRAVKSGDEAALRAIVEDPSVYPDLKLMAAEALAGEEIALATMSGILQTWPAVVAAYMESPSY